MDDKTRRQSIAVAGVALMLAAGTAVALWARDDGGPTSAASSTTSSTTTTSAAVAAQPTCADGSLGERQYILCTAGDAPDQALVVALHGRGSSAAEMQTFTELDRVAAGQGFAVVYPDGLDSGWGDDTFPTPSRPNGDEDVVFLDQLVASLRDDPRIDDGPVGVVGFSNGASMALRYAVQRPEDVGAVAAVAGQLPRDLAIRPTAAVLLLAIYGTADPVRSYDDGIPDAPGRQPGQPTPTLSTPDTMAAFVAAAGGTAASQDGPTESDPDPADGTTLRTESWTSGATSVVLQSVVGGGHTWPSARGAGPADFGAVSRDLDASVEAIAFLNAALR